MYKKEVLSRRNIYDDRGFVSSTEVYDNGRMLYTDYLTEAGVTKLRVYAETGAVEINASCNTYQVFKSDDTIETRTFKETIYMSLTDVILEVLEAHIEDDNGDVVITIYLIYVGNLIINEK